MQSGSNVNPSLTLALVLAFSATLAGAQTAPAPTTVEGVLAKMDSVSKSFTGMEASIDRTMFTALVSSDDRDRGKVFFSKQRNGETRIRIDITDTFSKAKWFPTGDKGVPKTVLVDKGVGSLFEPKLNQVQEKKLDPAKQRDIAEFLLVGFGTSSADIRKLYDINPKIATEEIDGKRTTILELKPKAGSQAAAEVTSIVLWLDQERWVPVRTKVTLPSKNTHTVIYSGVKMGAPKDSAFELKMPKDVKRVPVN